MPVPVGEGYLKGLSFPTSLLSVGRGPGGHLVRTSDLSSGEPSVSGLTTRPRRARLKGTEGRTLWYRVLGVDDWYSGKSPPTRRDPRPEWTLLVLLHQDRPPTDTVFDVLQGQQKVI